MDNEATTLLVTCPQTVIAPNCGVSEAGMTAILKKNSVQLVDVNKKNSTASLSCHITGTTYASCYATNEISVHATLAPKDLNWMALPVMSATSTTTGALSSSISTQQVMITSPVKLPSGTETAATPAAESQGTFWLKTSWGLYATMGSIMAGTLGYTLLFPLIGSQFQS
ncbi:hypothetical protein N7481_010322 [Penicillium waksmanii]|uniref:uncharacterized protein n=1 Tax=Penicillium waksmanii TaxID=69791 RepID=UPI00254802F5|nr:uncharacterized protein N7481_010322 [Penicillium waksmanii]KAJ5976615.1 hypothetical protein N7481_010322 [Penicillium waksmanii]